MLRSTPPGFTLRVSFTVAERGRSTTKEWLNGMGTKHKAWYGDQTEGMVWGPNRRHGVGTKQKAWCGDQTEGMVWGPTEGMVWGSERGPGVKGYN